MLLFGRPRHTGPLPARQRFLGPLAPADRAEHLATAAVLLSPTWTNLPGTVLMAMAAGCAVVAVNGPSVRWLLADGDTAALALPAPHALANALAWLLTEPEARAALAERAIEAVAGHDRESCAAQLRAVECPEADRGTGGQAADQVLRDAVHAPRWFHDRRAWPAAELAGSGFDDPLGQRLRVLGTRTFEVQEALRADQRALPYRLAHYDIRSWWARPVLPPLSERPWPPDAPATTKLARTLRHYGVRAVFFECLDSLRWRRMSPAERAAARDRFG